MTELSVKGTRCTVDYFDSFTMKNRFDEPAGIISLRKDLLVEVEVSFPVRKRIIVPFHCIKVETIA